MIRKAVYAGTFDPFTLGHLSILERALLVFDELIVAVNAKSQKECLFDIDERIKMIKAVLDARKMKNVKVKPFDSLLSDFLEREKVFNVVRGLRVIDDFNSEFQMAMVNKSLCGKINVMFLPADPRYMFLSSTLIKEIASYGGSIKNMLPPAVEKMIISRLRK